MYTNIYIYTQCVYTYIVAYIYIIVIIVYMCVPIFPTWSVWNWSWRTDKNKKTSASRGFCWFMAVLAWAQRGGNGTGGFGWFPVPQCESATVLGDMVPWLFLAGEMSDHVQPC